MRRLALAVTGMLIATPAYARDREYCPTRPGLGETPCTIAPGHLSVETGLADWTRDDDGESRSDTITWGKTQARLGVGRATEISVTWAPFVRERVRDRASGLVDTARGTGDVTVSLQRNLRNPDGKGLSFAVMPFASLPIGTLGDGDWGAGLEVPASFDIGSGLSVQSTSIVEAAVNESGDGRHFAASEVIGLAIELSKAINLTLEAQALRDADPQQHSWQALGSAALAWTPRDDLQLDLGAVAGLNHEAPDVEVYAGISRRF